MREKGRQDQGSKGKMGKNQNPDTREGEEAKAEEKKPIKLNT